MSQKFITLFEKKAPDFLEAFRKLVKGGIFERFLAKTIRGVDLGFEYFCLEFSGCLPGEKVKGASRSGAVPFINVEEALNNIRSTLKKNEVRITYFRCETKYEDWQRKVEKGVKTIGKSYGRKVVCELSLNTIRMKRRKKK